MLYFKVTVTVSPSGICRKSRRVDMAVLLLVKVKIEVYVEVKRGGKEAPAYGYAAFVSSNNAMSMMLIHCCIQYFNLNSFLESLLQLK